MISVEPNLDGEAIENIEIVSFEYALSVADIHLILVDHDEFKYKKFAHGIVIDTKGVTFTDS